MGCQENYTSFISLSATLFVGFISQYLKTAVMQYRFYSVQFKSRFLEN